MEGGDPPDGEAAALEARWRAAEAALRGGPPGPEGWARAAAAAPSLPPTESGAEAAPLGPLLRAAAGPGGLGGRKRRCREAALQALRGACERLRAEGLPPSPSDYQSDPSGWEGLAELGARALAVPGIALAPSERAAALGLAGDVLEGRGRASSNAALLSPALAAASSLADLPEARRVVRLASRFHLGGRLGLLQDALREACRAETPSESPVWSSGGRGCRALTLSAELLRHRCGEGGQDEDKDARTLGPSALKAVLPNAAGAWAAARASEAPRAEALADELAAALADAAAGGALGFAAIAYSGSSEAGLLSPALQGLCGAVLHKESNEVGGRDAGALADAPPSELWDFLEVASPRVLVPDALAAAEPSEEDSPSSRPSASSNLAALEVLGRAAALARARYRPLLPDEDGTRAPRALALAIHAAAGWTEVAGPPLPRWSSPQLARVSTRTLGLLLSLCRAAGEGQGGGAAAAEALPAIERLLRPALRTIAAGAGSTSGDEILAAHTVAFCLQAAGDCLPTPLVPLAGEAGELSPVVSCSPHFHSEDDNDETAASWVHLAAKMSLACVSHPTSAIRLRGLAAVQGLLGSVPPQKLAWSRPLLAAELVRALDTADAEAWAPAALVCATCLPILSPGAAGVGSPSYELARTILRAGEARGGDVRFLAGWILAAAALFPRLGADSMLHLKRLVPLVMEALGAGGLWASSGLSEVAGQTLEEEAAAVCAGAARLLTAVSRQAWPRMHAHAPALSRSLVEARSRWEGSEGAGSHPPPWREGLLRDLDGADRTLGAVLEAFRGHRQCPAGGVEQEDGTLGALDWQLQEILDLA